MNDGNGTTEMGRKLNKPLSGLRCSPLAVSVCCAILLATAVFSSLSLSGRPAQGGIISIGEARSYVEEILPDVQRMAVWVYNPAGAQGTGTVVVRSAAGAPDTGDVIVVTARHLTESVDLYSGKRTEIDTLMVTFPLKSGGVVREWCSVRFRHPILDLAILQRVSPSVGPDSLTVTRYPTYAISSSRDVRPGQVALIVGFPFGIGTDRTVPAPIVQSGLVAYVDTLSALVLVDVTVNPGSSGSPVIAVSEGAGGHSFSYQLMGVAVAYTPGRDWTLRVLPDGLPHWVPVNTGLARVVMLSELVAFLRGH